jgi:hypothetical protein
MPIAVNQFALAESLVPFKFSVNPALSLKLGGSVALTGEFSVECWRSSPTQVVLALMKKRGATLTATFTAGAGLGAAVGSGDLIEAFFSAVAPGVDLTTSGLIKGDDRYKAINDVLKDCVSRAFSVSINASLAETFSHQSAFVYVIDLAQDTDAKKTAATDAALNAALNGDWSYLSGLRNAKELRNVVSDSRESKFTLPINLLGIFNYEKLDDFVAKSTIVHDDENGTVTVTDSQNAKRITAASTPYLAQADRLREVLYEATVATAAYALVGGKFGSDFQMSQSMLIYKARMAEADLRKALQLAVLIGELTGAQLDAIPISNPSHVLIDAKQSLGNDQLLKIFFADPSKGTAHPLDELTLFGRRTLIALLDTANRADARRIAVLNSDQSWHDLDESGGRNVPPDSPGSYSDWYDVTFWANDIHDVAKPLKDVLDAVSKVPVGSDPTKNKTFMKRRKVLQKAIGEVVHDTHAALEMGWPIAVMYALSGRNTGATLKASWSGTVHVPIP